MKVLVFLFTAMMQTYVHALPGDPVEYYSSDSNITNHFVTTKSGKALPSQSTDRHVWNVAFKDGSKTFILGLQETNFGDSVPFMVVQEKIITPGSTINEEIWDVKDLSFELGNGRGQIVRTDQRSMKLLFTKQSDGSSIGRDMTGKWPASEYVHNSKMVIGPDGVQSGTMDYKNMNIKLNGAFAGKTLTDTDMAIIFTPVNNSEVLNRLNVRTRVFLAAFTSAHSNAKAIAKQVTDCLSTNPTQCENLKNQYAAADVERERLWSSIQVEDVKGLEPIHVVDQTEANEGGGEVLDDKCHLPCNPPYNPPAAPTPIIGGGSRGRHSH